MPLDLFTDFVYVLATENMDAEQRNDFDSKLSGDYEAQARAERRAIAMSLG